MGRLCLVLHSGGCVLGSPGASQFAASVGEQGSRLCLGEGQQEAELCQACSVQGTSLMCGGRAGRG